MVTGSHILFDRNGLKFYTNTGEITKQDEIAIISANVLVEYVDLLPLPNADTRAFDLYIKRYLDVYASDLLKNKKLVFISIQALAEIYTPFYLKH
ncbi:hypothetical protein [Pseudoalteromonas distincta]|uniref:hypothetical protein n=1 Tax=Pseudoalteromonas distincta TaxID=77608 RepID=UPI0026D8C348